MAKRIIVEESKHLSGKITVSSAKNSILPIMAATLLTKKEVVILNVPNISDIDVMAKIMESVGSKIQREKDKLIISNETIDPSTLNTGLMEEIRGSCLILGPIIARVGYCRLPFPGGCKIGARPVDLHLDALRKLGVNVQIKGNEIIALGKIKPGNIRLEFPSVGASENIMMAAALCKGYIKIENAAMEPEITDLGNFLNSLGVKVFGHGTNTIVIEGQKELGACIYTPICDRIEAGTYIMAMAATASDVVFENVNPLYLDSVIFKLRQMGIKINTYSNSLRVRSSEDILSTNIICMPYPGFPTDLQPPMCSLMTMTNGVCLVEEKIFNNRFMHLKELKKMGGDIQISGNIAKITGVTDLYGKEVLAKDLRGGAALILAGMIAKGKTKIGGVKYIERGYDDIVGKLSNVGANIDFE